MTSHIRIWENLVNEKNRIERMNSLRTQLYNLHTEVNAINDELEHIEDIEIRYNYTTPGCPKRMRFVKRSCELYDQYMGIIEMIKILESELGELLEFEIKGETKEDIQYAMILVKMATLDSFHSRNISSVNTVLSDSNLIAQIIEYHTGIDTWQYYAKKSTIIG
jgi:hypothetical protein